ncbi:MAG TPA: alpha/beta hydrolase family protein [Pyrinomonadaceae bacterium]|nr:alpha/beta hydrolase family protein [Pyrinomonadaceae bacterium]
MKMITRFTAAIILSLILFICGYANGRVETVRFQSKLMNTSLPYNVILPTDYDTSPTTRYPVLYLLHGLTGHYSDWASRSNVGDYAQQYRLIVVMPEGNDGWYTNSATVITDKYESYILNELLPDVQQRYRTIEARYGRAIAGLSMGGFGAIKFGLKAPQTFAFAASMSGAFAITRIPEKELGPLGPVLLKLFGPIGSDTRKANDIFDIVENMPPARVVSLPYFYFDCGTEDPLPTVFTSNRDLAKLMFEKKIPHEFRQLPGDHSWGYWDQQVQHILQIAAQKMRLPSKTRAAGA